MNADGSGQIQLTDNTIGDLTPSWSPDGKKIVFHIWDFFSNDAQIYAKDIDGSESKQLTRASGRNFQPSWQPVMPAAP